MRQTFQPSTAGLRQQAPVRFERAVHRFPGQLGLMNQLPLKWQGINKIY